MAEGPDRRRPDRARDERTGGDSAAARIRNQTQWVDLQIKRAMERGEFDNLPGAGKPLGDLGSPYDRDWWLKKLIEREQITVLPAARRLPRRPGVAGGGAETALDDDGAPGRRRMCRRCSVNVRPGATALLTNPER